MMKGEPVLNAYLFDDSLLKESTLLSVKVFPEYSTELAEMLMQKYGWDMKRALDELYSSETYRRLCNPACGLYYEGAVYVFSYLENEIETGVVK